MFIDYNAPKVWKVFQTAPSPASPVGTDVGVLQHISTGGPVTQSLNSFKSKTTLTVGDKTYTYYSLPLAEKNGLPGISKLPHSMKVVLENLLRFEDGITVTKADIMAVAQWLGTRTSEHEISYRPARVLMQDFTGVPAVVDLAAMRDATK
jgi:aconitate hydratase